MLWADEEGSTFFAWGGAISDQYIITEADELPGNAIWQFFPNGDSGAWSQVTPDGSGLGNLFRPQFGAGAFGNGVGYQYGGFVDEDDAVDLINTTIQNPIPGIVSYNFRDNSWTNASAPANASGSQRFGEMQFAGMFGSKGVLLAFGGGTYGVTDETVSLSDIPLSSLSKIDIFDPSSQKVSREIKLRDRSCP